MLYALLSAMSNDYIYDKTFTNSMVSNQRLLQQQEITTHWMNVAYISDRLSIVNIWIWYSEAWNKWHVGILVRISLL